ncbi:hypothetical protein BGZ49_001946, partial [Haplosporangium sp. Z 27]
YAVLAPTFFDLKDFFKHHEEIAKTLAGAIIQTDYQAILILKVEVYARSPIEDPHSFDLAIPTINSKIVCVIHHDGSRISCGHAPMECLNSSLCKFDHWDIGAGASNVSAHLATYMIFWRRADFELNPSTKRQLRSKFDRREAFFECASIFPLVSPSSYSF